MHDNAELNVHIGNALSTASFDEQQYWHQFAEDQAADPELAHILEVLENRTPCDCAERVEYKEARCHAKHMALKNGLLV